MVEQPLQSGRRAIKRHFQFLTEHGHRHVDLLDAGEDIRHQIAVLEGARVPPIRRLVVGCAVDIVEDRPRQTPPRQFAKIMEIMAVLQAHDFPPGPVAYVYRRLRYPDTGLLPEVDIGCPPGGPTSIGPSPFQKSALSGYDGWSRAWGRA